VGVVIALEGPVTDDEAVPVEFAILPPETCATALAARRDDPELRRLDLPVGGFLLYRAGAAVRDGLLARRAAQPDAADLLIPVLEIGEGEGDGEYAAPGLRGRCLAAGMAAPGLATWLQDQRPQRTPAGQSRRLMILVAAVFLVIVLGGMLAAILFGGGGSPTRQRDGLRARLAADQEAGYPAFEELAGILLPKLAGPEGDDLREDAWRYAGGRAGRPDLVGEDLDLGVVRVGMLALRLQARCRPGEQAAAELATRQQAFLDRLARLVTAAHGSTATLERLLRLLDGPVDGAVTVGAPIEAGFIAALGRHRAGLLRAIGVSRLREVRRDGGIDARQGLREMVDELMALRERVVAADLGGDGLIAEVEAALAFLRRFPLHEAAVGQVEVVLARLQIDGPVVALERLLGQEERWWLLQTILCNASDGKPVRCGAMGQGLDLVLSRGGHEARILTRLPDHLRNRYRCAFAWRLDQELSLLLEEDDPADDDDLLVISSRAPVLQRSSWSIRGLDLLMFKAIDEGVTVDEAGRPAAPGTAGVTIRARYDVTLDGRPIDELPALLIASGREEGPP
jgi:hypothetical protein